MRTTTRSSDRLAALAFVLISACSSPTDPATFFQLTPESAKHRAAETRFFEAASETELLSASAAVLQDLGFQVAEISREVGFLRAAKERSAREYGQEIWRVVILLLSRGSLIPVDLHQQVNAALVARALDEKGSRHEVRVLFYRLVWKGDGQTTSQYSSQYIPPGEQRMEMIRDPEIYRLFFAKLSKAVFLEAHRI